MNHNQQKLFKLLTFSHVTTLEGMKKQAKDIAFELLKNWTIVSPKGPRRFLGLEFYLTLPGLFEDDVTAIDASTGKKGASHKRKEQLSVGTFYFHTKSKGDKWSHPLFNRHGVDITCGNEELGIYGGILIRHVSGLNHRDGSGLALRAIVRGDLGFEKVPVSSVNFGWSQKERDLFARMNNHSIFGGEIHLAWAPTMLKEDEVKAYPRIGIEKTRYAQELLRFSIF